MQQAWSRHQRISASIVFTTQQIAPASFGPSGPVSSYIASAPTVGEVGSA